MAAWLEVILEIIKVTVPALIVFFTVNSLLKKYFEKELAMKSMEFRHNQASTTVPLRLQAYERLSLYLERIGIPGMMLRVEQEGMSANQLRLALMITVQQEYEHNITQQVYVSEQLWNILTLAREDVLAVIHSVYDTLGSNATAKEYGQALVKFIAEREGNPLGTGLAAIKKEAGLVL